jgi:hypothetical protein
MDPLLPPSTVKLLHAVPDKVSSSRHRNARLVKHKPVPLKKPTRIEAVRSPRWLGAIRLVA